ncbi:MAG: pyridoxal phosphate-dependent aminotransferase [Firmicutes bacterium]|nr:pyridoxal phosphate-dependent aminotransferase [Bacillota bacterium]
MFISKRVKDVAHSIPFFISEQAAKLRAEGRDISLFGAGETGFETPEYVKTAAKVAIDAGHTKYTAIAGILPLREAICKKLREDNGLEYTPDQIVVSNGAKQSLWNILYSVVNEGDEVIVIKPYWLTYAELVRLAGGVVVEVSDTKEIKAAITEKTRVIMLCTPNNPDGKVIHERELRALAKDLVGSGIWLISDEMYEKLIYGKTKHFSIARVYDKTITVGGVSKSIAMTGWRVGWTACCAEFAATMTRFQSHTTCSICTISQYAALEALSNKTEHDKFVSMVRQSFQERRDYVVKRLHGIAGVKFQEPEGAFYALVDVSKFGEAFEITQQLLQEADVAAVPCETFGAPGHIRLSYAQPMEALEKGLDRIEGFFARKIKEVK